MEKVTVYVCLLGSVCYSLSLNAADGEIDPKFEVDNGLGGDSRVVHRLLRMLPKEKIRTVVGTGIVQPVPTANPSGIDATPRFDRIVRHAPAQGIPPRLDIAEAILGSEHVGKNSRETAARTQVVMRPANVRKLLNIIPVICENLEQVGTEITVYRRVGLINLHGAEVLLDALARGIDGLSPNGKAQVSIMVHFDVTKDEFDKERALTDIKTKVYRLLKHGIALIRTEFPKDTKTVLNTGTT
ncbi:hypothetical protein FACS189449_00480 [Alphaproteobacteria bacterium]|nr:hypothetical protein FACS189449_00480 [Alphaproteobacteria bacterium]